MNDVLVAKRALRRELRSNRLRMSPEAVRGQSSRIARRMLDVWRGQQRVALFWPMATRAEVDLRELDAELRSRGVMVHYPRLVANTMEFRQLRGLEDLVAHPLGFLEPNATGPAASELDLVVVPALAVTRRGERLGYGGGHYDRALTRLSGVETVAVVYASELLDSLPTEPHDRRVRWVVTEDEVVGPIA